MPGFPWILTSPASHLQVKADKDDHHDSIEDLQEHTAKVLKEEKHKD